MNVLAVKVKTCNTCKVTKSGDEFYHHSNGRLMSRCKECDKAYKRKRYHSSKHIRDKVRKQTKERQVQKVFGISSKEYYSYFEDAVCSICSRNTDLVLDHCHNSGKIRGVLCRTCNTGIGHLRDSPELVARALYYLQEN